MPPLDEISVQTLNEIISAGVSSKLLYEGSVCDSYPCWNDGVCIESNLTVAGFFCLCKRFFAGDHCDTQVINNCTNVICPKGASCSIETTSCIYNNNTKFFPKCVIQPCKNGGNCIMLDSDRLSCVCPQGFHGLLCEISNSLPPQIPTTLNALQLIIIFAVIFLLVSSLITMCYGGEYSCYLNWPKKYRYDKWNPEVEVSSDDEDEDLIGGQQLYRQQQQQQTPNQSQNRFSFSATDNSKNCFELKNQPLKLSNTAETFVSLANDNQPLTPSHSANPVDDQRLLM